jgi:hypothetical protein
MPVKVTTRLDDIVFTEAFDTELEALAQARAWTKARIGQVAITHNGMTYTPEEFAVRMTGERFASGC